MMWLHSFRLTKYTQNNKILQYLNRRKRKENERILTDVHAWLVEELGLQRGAVVIVWRLLEQVWSGTEAVQLAFRHTVVICRVYFNRHISFHLISTRLPLSIICRSSAITSKVLRLERSSGMTCFFTQVPQANWKKSSHCRSPNKYSKSPLLFSNE